MRTNAAFPKYDKPAPGPGFVEIKPHNKEKIRAGLEQLAGYRRKRAETKRIYLLTYTYWSALTRDTSEVTGYLLKPTDATLNRAREIIEARELKEKSRKQKDTPGGGTQEKGEKIQWRDVPNTEAGQRAWLAELGTWWPLGTHKVWEFPFGVWHQVAGPPAIGSMLEYQLRTKFVETYGVPAAKHITRLKDSSSSGPDIDFLEIAEMLYELEAALERAA
jgi:hypothetical protein